jgi:transposase InsO family protein
MNVSRSGYYKWLRRLGIKSDRAQERAQKDIYLTSAVVECFNRHKRRYGAIRVCNELNTNGVEVSVKKVAKIMKINNLCSLHKKKFRVVTTNSKHTLPIAENVVNRDFSPKAPNSVWVADITYISTAQGWLYLATILDLFSRKIVGYATADNMERTLVLNALEQALVFRSPSQGLIFHSDRGVQFASNDFRKAIADSDFIQSMSRKANCWDNAPAESFFATLKKELIYENNYATRFHAERDIFEYIAAYYNTIRQHSYLGYLTPDGFEKKYQQAA